MNATIDELILLGMLAKMFDKMPSEKWQLHMSNAEAFLRKLDG
ncbi:hypothetical protein ACFGVS_07060 [Mucilaginibacter sp. AW1-7]